MAITITNSPQLLTPTYNQVLIAATSSNDFEPNFQFVADINVRGNTVSRVKIPVNPEGYGVFDIHRHLQNEITFDFNPNSLYFNTATYSFATYSVSLKEEYRISWDFNDNVFLFGAYVGFIGFGLPPFSVGEEIDVQQISPATNLSYDGYTVITAITATTSLLGNYIIETEKDYLLASSINPGTIYLSNRRLYTTPILASFSNRWIYNGVESFTDFINWNYLDRGATWSGDGSGKFLSNVPNVYNITRDSNMWLNLWTDDINKVSRAIITTDTNEIEIINDNTSQNLQLGAGPNQLQFDTFEIGSTASIKTLSRTGYEVGQGDMITADDTQYEVKIIGQAIDNSTLIDFNGATFSQNVINGPDGSYNTAFRVDFVDPNITPSNGVRTSTNSWRINSEYGGSYRVSIWAKTDDDTSKFRFVWVDPLTFSPEFTVSNLSWTFCSYTFSVNVIPTTQIIRIIPKLATPTPEGNYSIYFWNLNIEDITIEPKRFKIIDKCSRYEKIQLLFLDKGGSFIPYTFNMVNRQNKSIERTNYQQRYNRFAPASNNFRYNSWDRGMKTLDIVVSDVWTINSDWVNQTESDFLMTLFESPEVFWYKENGTIVAINITSRDIERKQILNDQVINYTLTFETSIKDMKQNG